MTTKDLLLYVQQSIKEHPDLSEEIQDLYELCMDEIDAGESEHNEIMLCVNSIDQLIKDL